MLQQLFHCIEEVIIAQPLDGKSRRLLTLIDRIRLAVLRNADVAETHQQLEPTKRRQQRL